MPNNATPTVPTVDHELPVASETIEQTPPVAPSKNSDHVLYYERQDAEYETYRQSFNKRITHSPKIIAVCLNETGVQEAIKYANYYQLPIAIKSGGHSFEGYCLIFSCKEAKTLSGLISTLSQ